LPNDMLSIRGALTAGLLCALCLAIAACGDSATSSSSDAGGASGESAANGYPTEVANRFTKFCTTNAKLASEGVLDGEEAHEVCVAVLACLERRLTFAEFLKVEERMQTGEDNPDAGVVRTCEDEIAERFLK
jgi:hypothetical protein